MTRAFTTRNRFLAVALMAGALWGANEFATGRDLSVTRGFEARAALTNSPIQVTVTLTNDGTNSYRGFYYTEEVPAGLALTPQAVKVNGETTTNYTLETGIVGDIFAGCIPWRWLLETPTNSAEAIPLAPLDVVQIVYAVTCPTAGTYSLWPYDWACRSTDKSNIVFGACTGPQPGTVRFVEATGIPLLSVQSLTNGLALWLDGPPYTSFVISSSSNLVNWVPIVTNLSPFTFVDTTAPRGSQRFYRAVPGSEP